MGRRGLLGAQFPCAAGGGGARGYRGCPCDQRRWGYPRYGACPRYRGATPAAGAAPIAGATDSTGCTPTARATDAAGGCYRRRCYRDSRGYRRYRYWTPLPRVPVLPGLLPPPGVPAEPGRRAQGGEGGCRRTLPSLCGSEEETSKQPRLPGGASRSGSCGRRQRHPRGTPRGTGWARCGAAGGGRGALEPSRLLFFIYFFLFPFPLLPRHPRNTHFAQGVKTLLKTNQAGIYSTRQILFLGGHLRKWSCRNCFLDLLCAAREEKSGDRATCCSDVKTNGPWRKGL